MKRLIPLLAFLLASCGSGDIDALFDCSTHPPTLLVQQPPGFYVDPKCDKEPKT